MFARTTKEKLDRSINLPFQHVKESLDVRKPRTVSSGCLIENELQTGTLDAPSVAAACLDEISELNQGGIDEEVIKDTSGVVYIGECHSHMAEGRNLTSYPWFLAGEETASETLRSQVTC